MTGRPAEAIAPDFPRCQDNNSRDKPAAAFAQKFGHVRFHLALIHACFTVRHRLGEMLVAELPTKRRSHTASLICSLSVCLHCCQMRIRIEYKSNNRQPLTPSRYYSISILFYAQILPKSDQAILIFLLLKSKTTEKTSVTKSLIVASSGLPCRTDSPTLCVNTGR